MTLAELTRCLPRRGSGPARLLRLARWTTSNIGCARSPALNALYAAGDTIWRNVERADILEALRHHPQIGKKRATGRGSAPAMVKGRTNPARSFAAEDVKTRLALGESRIFRKIRIHFHRVRDREDRGRDACASRAAPAK